MSPCTTYISCPEAVILGINSFDQEPGLLSVKAEFPYIVLEDNKQGPKKGNVKSKPGGKEKKEVLEIK